MDWRWWSGEKNSQPPDGSIGTNNIAAAIGFGDAASAAPDPGGVVARLSAGPEADRTPAIKDSAVIEPPSNKIASLGPPELTVRPEERQAEKRQAPVASEVIASRTSEPRDAAAPVVTPRTLRTKATADKASQAVSLRGKAVSHQPVRPATVAARSNVAPSLAGDRFVDPGGTAR